MKYEVHILDVGDADAIVVKYSSDDVTWVVAVVDAGNEGDGEIIKRCVGRNRDGRYHIDYAICTHPDKDHKGGFFDLLGDTSVEIVKMCVMDPWEYLEKTDFSKVRCLSTAKKKARAPFNSPSDNRKNLINIAEERGILHRVQVNEIFAGIPLCVIGPRRAYYEQCVLGMVEQFTELKDEPDMERFDEKAFPGDEETKSIIDEIEDESYTNKSSMVLLFSPKGDAKFLLCGDAASSSLKDIIDKCNNIMKNCIIKVPHHGSKHNLTTSIIDDLSPSSAVISAKGSKKHPNSAIVQWLSRYCNVYSTHKSGSLVYQSELVTCPAIPLKKRIDKNGRNGELLGFQQTEG